MDNREKILTAKFLDLWYTVHACVLACLYCECIYQSDIHVPVSGGSLGTRLYSEGSVFSGRVCSSSPGGEALGSAGETEARRPSSTLGGLLGAFGGASNES